MLPTSAELSYFLETASTQNISRASERLGISQPSLSLALKRLEDHIGSPLLLRSRTGVQLTKVGQRFQAKARLLLLQWESVLQEVKRDESEIAGCYKLGAHISVSCGPLARALPKILAQFPQLEIHMQHDLSRRVNERIINFDLDFGIVVNPISHPDLVIRKLYTDQVRFYCDTESPCYNPKSLLLCYDPELLQSRLLLKQARDAGICFQRFFLSSALEVIATMASAGAGVCILPDIVARKFPKLKALWPHIPPFNDTHSLVYRADLQCSPAAKAFAKALISEIAENSSAI